MVSTEDQESENESQGWWEILLKYVPRVVSEIRRDAWLRVVFGFVAWFGILLVIAIAQVELELWNVVGIRVRPAFGFPATISLSEIGLHFLSWRLVLLYPLTIATFFVSSRGRTGKALSGWKDWTRALADLAMLFGIYVLIYFVGGQNYHQASNLVGLVIFFNLAMSLLFNNVLAPIGTEISLGKRALWLIVVLAIFLSFVVAPFYQNKDLQSSLAIKEWVCSKLDYLEIASDSETYRGWLLGEAGDFLVLGEKLDSSAIVTRAIPREEVGGIFIGATPQRGLELDQVVPGCARGRLSPTTKTE